MHDRDFEAFAELLERERSAARELLERIPCPACELEPRARFRRICIVCGRLVEAFELEAHGAASEHANAPRGQGESDDTGPVLALGLDGRVVGLVRPRPPLECSRRRRSGEGEGEGAREAGGASGGAASAEARGVPRDPPTLRKHRQ